MSQDDKNNDRYKEKLAKWLLATALVYKGAEGIEEISSRPTYENSPGREAAIILDKNRDAVLMDSKKYTAALNEKKDIIISGRKETKDKAREGAEGAGKKAAISMLAGMAIGETVNRSWRDKNKKIKGELQI